jgi:hypothetical protein
MASITATIETPIMLVSAAISSSDQCFVGRLCDFNETIVDAFVAKEFWGD